MSGHEDSMLAEVIRQLDHKPWKEVLTVFAPVRAATVAQVISATGLSRRQVEETLLMLQDDLTGRSGFEETTAIATLDDCAIYAGRRGKPPRVFYLCALGARLLEYAGQAEARAFALHDERAIAHAVCTLDIRLAATGAGLHVATEKPLGAIRPDNLVTLGDGQRILYETEQRATPHHLARIVEKLRRLDKFFAAAQRNVSSQVYLLFNVSSGEWSRTRRIWLQALATVAMEKASPLSCELYARSLTEFLRAPQWGRTDAAEKLSPLKQQHRQPTSASLPPENDEYRNAQLPQPVDLWPVEWHWDASVSTDPLLLQAYQHLFETELADRVFRPAPEFLWLTQLIYAASHTTDTVLERVSVPFASLLLLRKYLESHPRLREELIQGLKEVRRARNAGLRLLQDRMTTLIWDTFLRHQGLACGGPLRVRVATPSYSSWRSDLHVEVSIPEDLLFELDDVVTHADHQRAEVALTWVLEALFHYTRELGLVEKGRQKKFVLGPKN